VAIRELDADLNIVQALVIPGLDNDLDIIQKLDDEPNDVGGLTAAELKAKFDAAGNIIKGYVNEQLLPSISETVAEAQARAEAEAARVKAEQARVEAERARVEAEQARERLEEAHAAAERVRTETENGRLEAERARVEAEESRREAERGRALAEQDRVNETAGVVAQAAAQAQAVRTQAEAAQRSAQAALDARDRAREEADRARAISGGDFMTRLEMGRPYGAACLDGEGLVLEAQTRWRRKILSATLRSPSRPTYGLNEAQEGSPTALALDVGAYTGTAPCSAIVSAMEYDALNVGVNGETAPDGTIILKKVEE